MGQQDKEGRGGRDRVISVCTVHLHHRHRDTVLSVSLCSHTQVSDDSTRVLSNLNPNHITMATGRKGECDATCVFMNATCDWPLFETTRGRCIPFRDKVASSTGTGDLNEQRAWQMQKAHDIFSLCF